MSEAVERLRRANRYEMKLENGIPITYRLPFMEELMIAGLLPLDLLEQLQQRMKEGLSEAEAEAVAQSTMEERLSEYENDFHAKQRVVAMMVDTIDGEQANLQPEDTLEIPAANFRQLISIAIRQEPPSQDGEPRAEGEA